jgi:hypothetical protein
MINAALSTPVAFIIFNRPSTTAQVFEAIRQARPRQLLVIADGPRDDHPEDPAKCAAAQAIIEQVDWDCDVVLNYSEINRGCKRRVSTGLDWVFSLVEEAIILEDDCLPHPTFFKFCSELLGSYRNDERIMTIGGCNFQQGRQRTLYSYYFSRYVHVWGWASWRRAWQHYSVEMTSWPLLRDTTWLLDILGSDAAATYWRGTFDKAYAGLIDTWDYQWLFACWAQNGLAVLPEINLVSNIGYGDGATHTRDTGDSIPQLPAVGMEFPLCHPPYIARHREADQFTFEHVFCPVPWVGARLTRWVVRKLRHVVTQAL